MKRLLIQIIVVAAVISVIVLLFPPISDVDRIEDWIERQPVAACDCSRFDSRPTELIGRWQTDDGYHEAVIQRTVQRELTCDWTFGPASTRPQTFARRLTVDKGIIQLDRPVPILTERLVSSGFCLVQTNDTTLLHPCGIASDDEQHVLKRIE